MLEDQPLNAPLRDRAGIDCRVPPLNEFLPRFPVPCFRMGRFAASADQHGKGIGRSRLGCAVDRCLKAREQVAARALRVHAKDAAAKAFYLHYGFLPLGR